MPVDAPLFWVLSEVDHHLVYPHPENDLPVVLVFSGLSRIQAFYEENPQKDTIAKGVFEPDLALMMRQWAYGNVEYFAIDPVGPQALWDPRPTSSFRDALPRLIEMSQRENALGKAREAEEKAQAKAAELAGLKDELRAKLHPPRPEPPAPPRPWYEAHGLD